MSILTFQQASSAAGPQSAIRGTITMPRVGAWVASLWVDSEVKPEGRVTIVAGSLTLIGTVNRAEVTRGITRVRVVAGADGLREPAAPKHYTSPTVRLVLTELLGGAGEALSSSADAGLLGRTLLAWTTVGIETGAMLEAVVHELPGISDAAWRIQPDGKVWVGRESWPDTGLDDFREELENPEEGWVLLGMDWPRLLPGQSFGDGRRADVVEHLITPDDYRAKVWLAP